MNPQEHAPPFLSGLKYSDLWNVRLTRIPFSNVGSDIFKDSPHNGSRVHGILVWNSLNSGSKLREYSRNSDSRLHRKVGRKFKGQRLLPNGWTRHSSSVFLTTARGLVRPATAVPCSWPQPEDLSDQPQQLRVPDNSQKHYTSLLMA